MKKLIVSMVIIAFSNILSAETIGDYMPKILAAYNGARKYVAKNAPEATLKEINHDALVLLFSPIWSESLHKVDSDTKKDIIKLIEQHNGKENAHYTVEYYRDLIAFSNNKISKKEFEKLKIRRLVFKEENLTIDELREREKNHYSK